MHSEIKKTAFTLIELSIVLVVVALLVGGVLLGKSLIHASELRAVGTEYYRFLSAVETFRDKYSSLPGDMPNATSYWGNASGGCPTGARTGTQTCNGNEDNKVTEGGQEHFLFWQHLVNAGMLAGNFTGKSGPADTYYDVVSATNSPASKVPLGIWSVRTIGSASGNPEWFDGTYDSHFQLGTRQRWSWNDSPVLTPEDLYNVDRKIDDGKPGTGKVVAYYWATCTTAADSTQTATAAYALTTTTPQCAVIFPDAF